MSIFKIVRDFAAEKTLGRPDQVQRKGQTLFGFWGKSQTYYGCRVLPSEDIDLIEHQLVQWEL